MNKIEIGRKIQAANSGPVELGTCKKFGLKQVGGSRTKIDGIHSSGTKWSIKNSGSRSTQVHLTTKNKFIKDFNLDKEQEDFVNKFFGHHLGEEYANKPRRRYKISEIPVKSVNSFKQFLENNKQEIVQYIVSGEHNIDNVVYNDKVMSTKNIYIKCKAATWVYNETAIHLKDEDKRTFFHLQMKGSGKGATKHGVLFHIHEHLFKSET